MAKDSLEAARREAGVGTVRLADGVTAYRVHGERGPWVVLVHGLLTPMYAWEGMAEALAAAGFRVLRYDQLGRGLSDRPDVRYDLPLYVRQLSELMTALGIERAHLVSWSMGCIVTSRLALEEPARVQHHVLIAPGLFVHPPLRLRVIARLPFARRIIASRAAAFIDALPAEHLREPGRFPGYLARMREQLRYPGLGASFASTVLHYPWGAGPELRQAGAHPRPVLLVWGEDDPATPYANAWRVQGLFPRAQLLTIPRGRHAPHVEHADEVNAAVARFLLAAASGVSDATVSARS